MHFPFKRAVTSVLAIGEEFILQSCCGAIPRPRRAHMNTHIEGGKEQPQWGHEASSPPSAALSPCDRHQNSFKATLRKGHGNVANLYPALWPEIASVTLPHGSAQPSVFRQQINRETIDLSTNITSKNVSVLAFNSLCRQFCTNAFKGIFCFYLASNHIYPEA